MSSVPRVCPACGAASGWDAHFCQRCGKALDGAEKTPRYYGAVSPGPALALGCALLAAALLALLAGSVIAAIVFAALAVVAFVLFYDAGKRNPESPVVRRVFSSAQHVRGWALFGRESSTAWAHALRDDVRLRGESRSLRHEREQAVRSLGDAAYREDEPAVTALRARLHEIDEELAKRDEARAETLAQVRHHVDEERAAAQATKRFSVDDLSSGGETKK